MNFRVVLLKYKFIYNVLEISKGVFYYIYYNLNENVFPNDNKFIFLFIKNHN